jgi:hypothetical protein
MTAGAEEHVTKRGTRVLPAIGADQLDRLDRGSQGFHVTRAVSQRVGPISHD